MRSKMSYRSLVILLLFGLCFAAFLSILVGRYALSVHEVITAFSQLPHIDTSQQASVLFTIRLPRIIASMLVGLGLAVAGATFQAVLNNPLASPDVLGTSSAAGFGAALGMLVAAQSLLLITLSSFVFGLLSLGLVYGLCAFKKKHDTLSILLAGIIVTSLFMALTSAIKFVADPNDTLPEITFWLMGSFSNVSFSELYWVTPLFLSGYCLLHLLRFKMNILSLGDEEAILSGINPKRLRILLLTISAILVSASVTIAGVIGWVGLVIPHLVRSIVGYNHGKLIPVSALIGALFLLVVDNLARSISAAEIPIGILTSLIGAPLFALLFIRSENHD
ncbi:FecCD family ABC transporter permease [Enterococcus faecalis]